MDVEKLEGLYQKILETSHDSSLEAISEKEIDYSEVVIPFSKMFKCHKPRDIYSGEEKIPFKERDQEFKMILRQEFSNVIKT
ncbi:MAG: hypothetical protein ACFFFT_18755 [Candidatus Thorarchaeota archaeon]